jgi:hypothetical protein
MIKKLATWLMFGVLCLVWLTAHSIEPKKAPPDTGLAKQSMEIKAIALQFYALPCFQDLRDTNIPSELPATLEDYMRVEIPPRSAAHDDFQYEVLLHSQEHTAYLVRAGGFAGVHQVRGPIPLGACIKQAVERSLASGVSL